MPLVLLQETAAARPADALEETQRHQMGSGCMSAASDPQQRCPYGAALLRVGYSPMRSAAAGAMAAAAAAATAAAVGGRRHSRAKRF